MPWFLWLIGGGILALIAYLAGRGPTRVPGGLAFGKMLSPQVARAFYDTGMRLQIDPSFLTVQAFMESRLNPYAHLHLLGKDATGRAVYRSDSDKGDIDASTIGGGLFGFMRSTAKGLGYELPQLLRAGSLEQLKAAEKMYSQMRRSGVLGQGWPTLKRVRLATYYPKKASLSEQPNAILWDSHSPDTRERKAYYGNPWTDKNKDGVTTVQEAIGKVESVLKLGLSKKYFLPDSERSTQ